MLSLSQTSGYAILALSCLEETGESWTLAKDITQRVDVPGPYLSKILHALAKANLIHAKRGYRGGFRLARNAEAITLLDIVEAVDGTAWASRCMLGLETCSDERACPTHAFWKAERARIQAGLRSLSLKHVADFENRRRARDPGRRLHERDGNRQDQSPNDQHSAPSRAAGNRDEET